MPEIAEEQSDLDAKRRAAYERQRRWKAAHPDRVRESQKRTNEKRKDKKAQWLAENPGKSAAYGKTYREKDRERWLLVKRRFYREHAERLRAERIQYHERNREIEAVRAREYQQKNKAYCAASTAARKARQKKAMPTWVDREDIKAIYVEAMQRGLTVDHIVPIKHDLVCGLHVPWNLQLLSMAENCSKHNKWCQE